MNFRNDVVSVAYQTKRCNLVVLSGGLTKTNEEKHEKVNKSINNLKWKDRKHK